MTAQLHYHVPLPSKGCSRYVLRALIALALILGTLVSNAALDRARLLHNAEKAYGAAGVSAVTDWLKLLDLAKNQPVDVQLQRVNEFFNARIRFGDDINVWGQTDYWATPLESMGRGAGDCEDFAIAKYISLLNLGIPVSKLRLIYVRANLDGRAQAHMILGYYAQPDSQPLILDNLNGAILPAQQRPDLTPVFSFNSQGLWAGNTQSPSDPTARLSNWRSVLNRIQQEGTQ